MAYKPDLTKIINGKLKAFNRLFLSTKYQRNVTSRLLV